MRKLSRRTAVACAIAITAALLPLTASAASPILTSDCGAVSNTFCGTSSNTSGYVNPSNEWRASTTLGAGIVNFAGFVYQDNNGIDNNVNSIRARGTSATYSGACYYFFANAVTAASYVGNTQPGWFDNSSTGLSSARWVTSSCL